MLDGRLSLSGAEHDTRRQSYGIDSPYSVAGVVYVVVERLIFRLYSRRLNFTDQRSSVHWIADLTSVQFLQASLISCWKMMTD